MDKRLLELAKAREDAVISWRRQLHRFPELGGQEHRTAALVEDCARSLGLEVLRVGETNRIAVLETGKPGRTILLRADMDALPVQENPQNLRRERTVVSEHEGVCHACGHDAHTAMLLGAMSMLRLAGADPGFGAAGRRPVLCTPCAQLIGVRGGEHR